MHNTSYREVGVTISHTSVTVDKMLKCFSFNSVKTHKNARHKSAWYIATAKLHQNIWHAKWFFTDTNLYAHIILQIVSFMNAKQKLFTLHARHDTEQLEQLNETWSNLATRKIDTVNIYNFNFLNNKLLRIKIRISYKSTAQNYSNHRSNIADTQSPL